MTLIGVSVPVPDPAGRTLQDLRVALGEDEARKIPTHVTLLPPLEVEAGPSGPEDLSVVCDHLERAAAEHHAFTVRLRGTGTFQPVSPVVFVNLVAGISECELLAADVRRGPLAVELDFPYHPHVTVAHQDDEAALERAFEELVGFEASFTVSSFWLYTWAENGWTPRHEFALGGS